MLFIDNNISVFCIVSKSLFRFAAMYFRSYTSDLNFNARCLVLVRFAVKVFVRVRGCAQCTEDYNVIVWLSGDRS